jgi:hypothetical protein
MRDHHLDQGVQARETALVYLFLLAATALLTIGIATLSLIAWLAGALGFLLMFLAADPIQTEPLTAPASTVAVGRSCCPGGG